MNETISPVQTESPNTAPSIESPAEVVSYERDSIVAVMRTGRGVDPGLDPGDVVSVRLGLDRPLAPAEADVFSFPGVTLEDDLAHVTHARFKYARVADQVAEVNDALSAANKKVRQAIAQKAATEQAAKESLEGYAWS
ncbi:hypothetical protein BH09ACT10_BH09ACT10_26140 [soil metagenome]